MTEPTKASSDSEYTGCTFEGAGGDGAIVTGRARIQGCVAEGNGRHGFNVSGDVDLIDSAARGNAGDGFQVHHRIIERIYRDLGIPTEAPREAVLEAIQTARTVSDSSADAAAKVKSSGALQRIWRGTVDAATVANSADKIVQAAHSSAADAILNALRSLF